MFPFRVTLDQSLQEELSGGDETPAGQEGKWADEITVVKEGEDIRALTCSSAADTEARLRPGSSETALGAPAGDYTVSAVSLGSVTRNQILRPDTADRP